MGNLRYLTSGESHGRALIGIIEGVPAGLLLLSSDIDRELKRRQGGYGRGGRMKIESDHADILSGVRRGKTLGSPISILIENRDWENWQDIMNVGPPARKDISSDPRGIPVSRPRPGHADLAGAIKYDQTDIRSIIERSSARETAMRVALGAIAKRLLAEFGIFIGSFVLQIGKVRSSQTGVEHSERLLMDQFRRAEKSAVRCADPAASKKMVSLIDRAIKEGDSLGGIFEVFAVGVPVGLGSHVQWDRKLDARLSRSVMSIQAIKGVALGMGFAAADRFGSEVMDEIFYRKEGFYRKTNNAGGIEGGMSNGMPILISAAMKPIPTLRKPLMSVDIKTKKPFKAAYERSDTCAVPAAAVVAEAVTALVLADSFLEKFGGDNIREVRRTYNSYRMQVRKF